MIGITVSSTVQEAVIGTRAVVTKNVPPRTIVGRAHPHPLRRGHRRRKVNF